MGGTPIATARIGQCHVLFPARLQLIHSQPCAARSRDAFLGRPECQTHANFAAAISADCPGEAKTLYNVHVAVEPRKYVALARIGGPTLGNGATTRPRSYERLADQPRWAGGSGWASTVSTGGFLGRALSFWVMASVRALPGAWSAEASWAAGRYFCR